MFKGDGNMARYDYSADGDTPDFAMDAGAVVERGIGLLADSTYMATKRVGGDLWTYPNVHGDIVATANARGQKQGATLSYDPYGQALAGLPDNSSTPLVHQSPFGAPPRDGRPPQRRRCRPRQHYPTVSI